jgi:hypothetical protein
MRVGARRGRVAHLAGNCRRSRAYADSPLDDTDGERRLCALCFPPCVVCQSAPGARLAPCPHAHGVCDECLRTHLTRHATTHPTARLRCPCGDGDALDPQKDLVAPAFAHWWSALTGQLGRQAADADPTLASVGATLCAEAHARACPHCGRRFFEFDGCAALACECGGWLCALCLQPHADSAACHAHVLVCPEHPVAATSSRNYYVPIEAARRVWARRARLRLRRALRRLSCADGLLVAWTVARAVVRRDPALLPRGPFGAALFVLAALRSVLSGVAAGAFATVTVAVALHIAYPPPSPALA